MTSFAGQANPPEPTRVSMAVAQYRVAMRLDYLRDSAWGKLNWFIRGFSHEEILEYAKLTGAIDSEKEVVSVK